ncbi:S66 peptidase family protein [Tsuneonella suprasediminis]|uniref:S66 peptidase family protein n=1 Tax=Tsuneonella suprasediminis TaxID=2306996 RepID=UPI0039C8EE8D
MIDRRGALAGAGALAAMAGMPLRATAKTRNLPPRLKAGDVVGIVAPSSALSSEDKLENAEHWLRGMGLVPKVGPHAGDRDGYLAGTDAHRAADINAMYADPEVRAVFGARGGWGGARLLPLLDWNTIRANPKLFMGFSDITALHLSFAAKAGYPTIHGGNATSSWPKEQWESFWRLAFAADTPTLGGIAEEQAVGRPGRTIHGGKARGKLLGGNLTIVSTLMGTPWVPDFTGAILFLEDIGESEYRIDRMFQQLRLAGILRRISGIVFGQCTDCRTSDADYDGFTLDQVIDQYLGPLGIPAFTGANIGHVRNQLCVPSGGQVELDADARTIRLLEPIVV